MPDSSRLPEFARSLRTLGASGNPCMHEAHEAIFQPLLDARTAAANASFGDAVDVMNGQAILGRIEMAVAGAAVRGVSVPSRARALTAHASEAIESLRRSLMALDELAVIAGTDEGWTQWVDQLRRVFEAADGACRALAIVLDERDVTQPTPRWFGRPSR